MGWPAGLPLRTCSLGPDFGIASGSDYGVDITVTASRPLMTWAATGAGALGDSETISIEPGAAQTLQLPVTDATGWLVGGVPVDVSGGQQSHLYNITIKPWQYDSAGRKKNIGSAVTLNNVAIPTGDGSTLDLDKSASMPGATGGTVTIPDYVAQLEAVASAPTDSFVAGVVDDDTTPSQTRAALDAIYEAQSLLEGDVAGKIGTGGPLDTALNGAYAPKVSPLADDVRSYGAIGDYVSHPLSSRFATLAAAQAVYPEATSLSDEIDWCAITRCIAVNGSAYLSPAAVTTPAYVINKPIDLTSVSGVRIYANKHVQIIQTTANTPVIKYANAGHRFENITAGYTSLRPSTETSSICFYATGGGTSAAYLNTFVGCVALNGAIGWTNDTATAVFSCSWRDCEVNSWSIIGFDIWTNYGETPNLVSSLYMHNNSSGSGTGAVPRPATVGGFRARGWQSGSVDNVNVEHCNAPFLISIDSCPGIVVRSPYLENCEVTVDKSGFLLLANSNTSDVPVQGNITSVDGLTAYNCRFSSTDAPTGVGMVYVCEGASADLRSLIEHGNTVTGSTAYLVYSDAATTASIYVGTVQSSSSGMKTYNSSLANQVKRYGDAWNTQTVPAAALLSVFNAGEATLNPNTCSASVGTGASQRMQLTYFTATRSETCNNVQLVSSGAAGATPTLVRIGIYSVDASGNLTLVASTPNDTSLFAASNTLYTKGLSAPFSKVQGQLYAVGVLVVSSATIPTLYGANPFGGTGLVINAISPRRAGRVSGQADLPASITAATVSTDGSLVYSAILP